MPADNSMDKVMSAVYDDLRVTVRAVISSEGRQHILQPAALIREACWRQFGPKKNAGSGDWQQRARFLAMAVRQMRLVLNDYSRKGALGKKKATTMISLLDFPACGAEAAEEFLNIDQLMNQLAASNPDAAQAFELRCFGGLTEWESASIKGGSTSQLRRDLDSARVWLSSRMALARAPVTVLRNGL